MSDSIHVDDYHEAGAPNCPARNQSDILSKPFLYSIIVEMASRDMANYHKKE